MNEPEGFRTPGGERMSHDRRTATEHHEAGAAGADAAPPEPHADAGPAAAFAPGRRAAEASDAELIRWHVAGDPDAFGHLFLRHRDRLWAVAIRTLSDPEEAADALQDAMISAFRRAESFRGDSAVTTWLHRIVVNACLDRMRRRAARPLAEGTDERILDNLAADHASPDPSATSDTSLDVMAALRTLPPDQQSALVLVDMLGYPVADAAAILGVSEGTVKSRCARGRARLLPRLAHLRQRAGPRPRDHVPKAGPTVPGGERKAP
jgi:RNA polymerase sigma-70 factor, ECF subfamily